MIMIMRTQVKKLILNLQCLMEISRRQKRNLTKFEPCGSIIKSLRNSSFTSPPSHGYHPSFSRTSGARSRNVASKISKSHRYNSRVANFYNSMEHASAVLSDTIRSVTKATSTGARGLNIIIS